MSESDLPARGWRPPHRPAYLAEMDGVAGAAPADDREVARRTAHAVLAAGRASSGEERQRLLDLAGWVGVHDLAELWRDSPPDTLAGALWALYLVRTWVRQDGSSAARLFAAGCTQAQVAHVVAGVADPPGPTEVAALGDAVLTSAFDGDLADALERAAAFARVVAAGRGQEEDVDQHLLGMGNLRLAERLERAARLERAGRLD